MHSEKHHTAPLKRNHGDGKAEEERWAENKWAVVTLTSSAALLQGLLLCLPATRPICLETAAGKHKIKSENKSRQNSAYSALFKGLKKSLEH